MKKLIVNVKSMGDEYVAISDYASPNSSDTHDNALKNHLNQIKEFGLDFNDVPSDIFNSGHYTIYSFSINESK